MLKFVLIAVAILLLLPLLRRKQKPSEPEAPPLPPAKSDAKKTFDALLRTVVVLDGNEWSACTVDGVKEDWARFTAEAVRGFEAVPSGRHRVVTEVDGRTATLDFVLFPGEVLARKLDRDGGRWVEADTARPSVETLVSYRSTMGIARAMSGKLASPEAAFEKAKSELEALVARGGDADPLVQEARTIGESLIGIPLVGDQLAELVALAKKDASKRIVEAALPGISRSPKA